jgi:SAM-dependent methyltransferase
MTHTRLDWEDRYREGPRPWDTGITPPEVYDFWRSNRIPTHQRGSALALDIGCGPGTNVAFLAQLGLSAIGFDLSGIALSIAKHRITASRPDLLPRIGLIQADVSRLPIRSANAVYILDIGCLHGLLPPLREDYAHGVIQNLSPGGYYQLFAFDRLPEAQAEPDKQLRGMEQDEVATMFAPELYVVDIFRGTPDRQPCRWYLLQKKT